MTKLIVIDATVAIKWFVNEEFQREEAMRVLDAVQNSPQSFVVPELFFNEMLSVFCRLVSDVRKVQTYMRLIESLGFERVGNGTELLSKAAKLAIDFKITGYDAIYAATANLTNAQWLTADQRAHKRIESLRISRVLADF